MRLTANRRIAFSASRRLARPEWPAEENERVYGAGRERTWGSGENYQAFFVFGGEPDPDTGMLVNLTDVKRCLATFVDTRYDHAFLNLDVPPFDHLPPTPEELAVQLLAEARVACGALPARPVACHLAESGSTGATAYADGRVESVFTMEFSAARRTFSPHLSEAENAALFGRAASPAGHGHGYHLQITLAGAVDRALGLIVPNVLVAGALASLHELLDHRNLNVEVPALAGQPMTTECLARFVFERLAADLPLARVRLHENPRLFAEHDTTRTSLGMTSEFSAAHCLRNPRFSDAENRRIFGKCANPNGHGHRYRVEATVTGDIDSRSGIVAGLSVLQGALEAAVAPWDRRHLDRETDDFRDRLSTGENIVLALWPRLDDGLGGRLGRVRLAETENNRFTLRRGGPA
ncbi:MAG: 6-carboxytetrahydropterin synthase [Acidobacteriota bacterium]